MTVIRQRGTSNCVKEIYQIAFLYKEKLFLLINRIFDVLHFSHEYDPDRYEGDEQDKEVVSITKSSEEASTGTVISSTNAKTGDLDKQLSLEVVISILNFKVLKNSSTDSIKNLSNDRVEGRWRF
jgi:hypothetical protein